MNDPGAPSLSPSAGNRAFQHLETVFLDRDGVLNRKMPEGRYVTRWAEFEPLPGVAESILRLNRRGIRVIVVTNQRGIALGLYTAADVEAIHRKFEALLAEHGAHVDAFFYCPHDKRRCTCRKPLPGMFEQAKAQFPAIDPATTAMVGDSLADIQFGENLGFHTIFIDRDPLRQKAGAATARKLARNVAGSLEEAVGMLIG